MIQTIGRKGTEILEQRTISLASIHFKPFKSATFQCHAVSRTALHQLRHHDALLNEQHIFLRWSRWPLLKAYNDSVRISIWWGIIVFEAFCILIIACLHGPAPSPTNAHLHKRNASEDNRHWAQRRRPNTGHAMGNREVDYQHQRRRARLAASMVHLTMVDETALRMPIVIQMTGKTLMGGIQSGRLRSIFASFSVAIFGRRAFSTPNVLGPRRNASTEARECALEVGHPQGKQKKRSLVGLGPELASVLYNDWLLAQRKV